MNNATRNKKTRTILLSSFGITAVTIIALLCVRFFWGPKEEKKPSKSQVSSVKNVAKSVANGAAKSASLSFATAVRLLPQSKYFVPVTVATVVGLLLVVGVVVGVVVYKNQLDVTVPSSSAENQIDKKNSNLSSKNNESAVQEIDSSVTAIGYPILGVCGSLLILALVGYVGLKVAGDKAVNKVFGRFFPEHCHENFENICLEVKKDKVLMSYLSQNYLIDYANHSVIRKDLSLNSCDADAAYKNYLTYILCAMVNVSECNKTVIARRMDHKDKSKAGVSIMIIDLLLPAANIYTEISKDLYHSIGKDSVKLWNWFDRMKELSRPHGKPLNETSDQKIRVDSVKNVQQSGPKISESSSEEDDKKDRTKNAYVADLSEEDTVGE
jgi:hypothetical protein